MKKKIANELVYKKYLTDESLSRSPSSRLDKCRLMLEHRSARKRFYEARQMPIKSLSDDFPGIERKCALVQATVKTIASSGNMPVEELVILSTLCAYLKPKRVFEFGTYDGLTTLHLAMNSDEDCQITTIDLAPDDPLRQLDGDDTFYTKGVQVGAHFERREEKRKIQQLFSDTTKFDHSSMKGKLDLIFVDAGHIYELVRSDTEKSLDMIKPGGVIVWHDYFYTHLGVYTLLNERSSKLKLSQVAGTSLVYYVSPLN